MSALPILVEWGNVISKIVVGGVAGLALLGYRALRNRADVKPAREDANRMGLSIDEPREGPIAVRGTYRSKDGEQWLECSGQRVALAGDLLVVRGSSATWKGPVRMYALRDGDTVLAIGKMEQRASTESTGYRDAAGGWQLGPSGGEPVIQICVAKPVPCPRPLWPIRGVLALALAGVAAYFGLGAIGKKLVAYHDYPREQFFSGDGASTLAAQIACALPRSREAALRRYEIDLEYKPRTDDVLAKRVAMAGLRDCRSAVELWMDFGRAEQAIDVARDCHHPEYSGEALLLLGKYEEAARVADPSLDALIGAGRWKEAAANVGARTPRPDDNSGNDQCFARYLTSLAGEPTGPSGTGKLCRIVEGVFDDVEDKYDSSVEIAAWAADGESDGFIDSIDIAQWFAQHVNTDTYLTHALRAHLALDLGQFDLAAIEIEKAVALRVPIADEEMQQYAKRRDRDLANELALRTGKPIEPFELSPERDRSTIEGAAALRSGAKADDVSSFRWTNWEPLEQAMDAAASGDGLLLARAFDTFTGYGGVKIDTEFLIAVAPKITKHRDEVARGVQLHEIGTYSITATVHQLALQRDLLRLLGDKAGVDRLQAIIERHAKVFSDPQKLKALLLSQVR